MIETEAGTQTQVLDCKGLMCPMPFVKMFRFAKQLQAGQQLVVEATDPSFQTILGAWVDRMNYRLVELKGTEVQRAVIQVN
ncbi:MAG: sulfurtransferase TusA family protein [Candidatus Sericytochromatia bacterium]